MFLLPDVICYNLHKLMSQKASAESLLSEKHLQKIMKLIPAKTFWFRGRGRV